MNKTTKPKVSIGTPVYNGENFLIKRIDSILNQTFKDFELIISDNASTDSTYDICQKYTKKDKRIRYFRQKNNIGPGKNFQFVLQQAKGEYFTWAAVDDLWEPTFLTKNIEILESDPNMVGSISEVDFFGKYADRYNSSSPNILKHRHVRPISGNYFEKASLALRSFGTMIYGLFRTEFLKKSISLVFLEFGYEWILIINILKYGNLHVVDELLMHRSADGVSSVGKIHALRAANVSRLGILFLYYPFMKWSLKNLGLKFMLKNFSAYVRILYIGYGRIILDLVRSLKHH